MRNTHMFWAATAQQDSHAAPKWTVQENATQQGVAACGCNQFLLPRQIRPPYCTDRRLGSSYKVNHQDVLLTFHPSCTPPPAQRQTISLASVKPEPLFKTTYVEHIPFQHEWSTNHRQKNAIRCFSDHLDSTCTSAAANIIAQRDRLSCCPQLA